MMHGILNIKGTENVMDQKVQHSNKWSLKCRTIETTVTAFKGGRNLKKKQRNLLKEVYKLDVGKEFPYLRVKLLILARLRRTEIQHKSHK
jgi:hypothetical protein